LTIDYGYRPSRALIWLAVFLIAGTLTFSAAYPEALHPTKPGSPEQPAFSPFRYTVDLLLPVANFKEQDAFVADGWAAWASFGFTLAGWLLATVVVAGLAGVFKGK
jgi:disulfide bond formation protein DsbB